MKKAVLSCLLAMVCFVSFLSGCSGAAASGGSSAVASSTAAEGAGSSEGAAEGAGLEGELQVAAWTQAATALEQVAEKFTADNPGVTITVNQVDSTYTKLYPSLASGIDVPDVFQVQQTDFPSFMEKYEGSFADLTDIIEPEKDNFAASALKAAHSSKDGKYYAIPWDIGPCALMYRVDLFEQAGVDAQSIKTWDNYIEAGEKVLQATNGETRMMGFCLNGSTSQDLIKLLFHQLGGSYYAEDGSVDLASKEMLQVVDLVNRMIEAGVIMDCPDEWNDRITALNNNQVATMPYPSWYYIVMKDSVADQAGQWAYVPLPTFEGDDGYTSSLGGAVLAVHAGSEQLELAKAFAQYALMNPDNAAIMFGQAQFQSYKPFYEDPVYHEVDEYFDVSIGETFMPLVDSPEIEFGSYFTDIAGALGTAMGEMFINGKDPQAALEEASATANRAIEQQQ